MLYKKYILSFALLCAVAIPMQSQAGISLDLGPFDFRIGGGVPVGNVGYVEDPICQAIRETDLVELYLVVEDEEEDSNEPSRIIVEPYALGFNEEGKLILRGYQIEGFEIAEGASNESDENVDKGAGFIGGVYSSFKGKNEKRDFNISKIEHIRVIENSDFAIRSREDISSENEDGKIVDYICAIGG